MIAVILWRTRSSRRGCGVDKASKVEDGIDDYKSSDGKEEVGTEAYGSAPTSVTDCCVAEGCEDVEREHDSVWDRRGWENEKMLM